MAYRSAAIFFLMLVAVPGEAFSQAEIVEVYCPSCGYRERFVQGADASDQARNVQHVIVVCERSRMIRNVKVPLDPQTPVEGEPLLARRYGTGTSKLLGVRLPKFLVPGNTCPLYPVTAYLDANICPIDGQPGVRYGIVGYQ